MTKINNESVKKPRSIARRILLTTIPTIVFSLGFFPVIVAGRFLLILIEFDQIWHFLLLPFLITLGIAITIYFQLITSGTIIHVFNIKYKPGIYEYNYRDKNSYKWIIICALYTPLRKTMEIISVGGLKYVYYRLLGMKLGDNTLVGGTIMDPCLTEIGDNCTIGLYAVIYGHIHDYEEEKILFDKVIIGDNCVIGAGAFIMPGAILEDGVKLAAGAVVKKCQILKKGRIYAGVPAKEIKRKTVGIKRI